MKRSLSIAVAILLSAVPSTGGADAAPQHAESTVTVWEDLTNSSAQDGLAALADKWGAANGASVTFVNVGGPNSDNNEGDLLLQKAKKKDGPDLMYFPEDQQGFFAVSKLFAPRPAGVLSPQDLARYQPIALGATLVDGVPYSIPHDEDSLVLLYNKRLLPGPPTTWAQVIAISKRLAKGNHYGFLSCLSCGFYADYWAYGGYGAYVFGNKGGKVDVTDIGLDTAAAVEALTFIRSLTTIVPKSTDSGFASDAFLTGRSAMTIDGQWNFDLYAKSLGSDLGVTSIPALPGGRISRPFVGVRVWAVNRFSKNQTGAWSLARYLSLNGQAITAQFQERLPTLKVVPGFTPTAIQAASEQQFKTGILMPNAPAMHLVWTPEDIAVQNVVLGKASPGAALKTALQQIRKDIAALNAQH